MRTNSHTVLAGSRAVLVPYRKEHVAQYNRWMTDPTLLAQTSSEPLSLEQEYANQLSWQADSAKITFIVCDAALVNDDICVGPLTTGMIGDVNGFLWPDNEAEEDVQASDAACTPSHPLHITHHHPSASRASLADRVYFLALRAR